MRLDVCIVSNKDIVSRSRAKNMIQMGFVKVNGKVITKAGFEVEPNDEIEIVNNNFASIGSFKLEKALKEFNYEVENSVCLDIGASNGGFTEVLLKNGAKRVYAVDVGECALPDYLKDDRRVIIKEKLNARYITADDIAEKANLIVIDVSFISLKLIIPNMIQFLKKEGHIIALIKPQFEGKKCDLNKKGIVKSNEKVLAIVKDISDFCKEIGLKVISSIQSPKYFDDKNAEWLIFLQLC